jgi:DNA-binding NarL/FixJ family response regulator
VCLTLASLVALEVCEEAANGREAVERAQESSPDLIILDVTMPVMNGLDAARQIRAFSPLTPILILTMHKSRQLMEEARRIGVQGYVVKAEAGQSLGSAVSAIMGNVRRFSPPISDKSSDAVRPDSLPLAAVTIV